MIRIETIRREQEIGTREEWLFWFNDSDGGIYLDKYNLLERPTTRHKYRVARTYRRIDGRNNTIDELYVPLPEDVRKEALDSVVKQLKVKKWSER